MGTQSWKKLDLGSGEDWVRRGPVRAIGGGEVAGGLRSAWWRPDAVAGEGRFDSGG